MGVKTLTGSINPTALAAVVGVGTSFTTEVAVGDVLIVSGESRTVLVITDNTHLTVDTAFSDNADDTSPDILTPPTVACDVTGDIDCSGVYRAGTTAGVSGGPYTVITGITVKNGIITAISGT
jgi:hypothetical protein